jgi:hypothetical protein
VLVIQQANLICQTHLIRNHNQVMPSAPSPESPPPYAPIISSDLRPQYQPLSPSTPGLQGENAGIDLSTNDASGFDGLRALLPPLSRAIPSSWLGSQPDLMFVPNSPITVQAAFQVGPSTRDPEIPSSSIDRRTNLKNPLDISMNVSSSSHHNSMSTIAIPAQGFFPHSIPTTPNDASMNSRSNTLEWCVETSPKAPARALVLNPIHTITEKRGVFRVRFSPDGQLLAVVATASQVVSLYNVISGARIWSVLRNFLLYI